MSHFSIKCKIIPFSNNKKKTWSPIAFKHCKRYIHFMSWVQFASYNHFGHLQSVIAYHNNMMVNHHEKSYKRQIKYAQVFFALNLAYKVLHKDCWYMNVWQLLINLHCTNLDLIMFIQINFIFANQYAIRIF